MKIYGIEVVMPHSGDCKRSIILTAMKKDMQNYSQEKVTNQNLKNNCENSVFQKFKMEDINYSIFGTFK
tara:strand:- start:1278 stop:1484 length:207 start_codon:yes stop_codon:yes gene_type:complete